MKLEGRCCRDYIKLFDDYVDKELSEEIQQDFKEHIQSCRKCWSLFRTYNLTVTLSRKTRHSCMISTDQIQSLCSILCTKLTQKE